MKSKSKANPKATHSRKPKNPSSKSSSPPIPKLAGKNPYQQFQTLYDPNIVDEATSKLPKVIAARRKMHKASKQLQEVIPNRSLFVAYDDAWSSYQLVREQTHFNFGFGMGVTAGVAKAAHRSHHDQAFMKDIIHTLYQATLNPEADREMIIAGLLEMARALLVGREEKIKSSLEK